MRKFIKWFFTVNESPKEVTKVMYSKTVAFAVGRVQTILHMKDGGMKKGPEYFGLAFTWTDAIPHLSVTAKDNCSRNVHQFLNEPSSVETVDGLFIRSIDIDHVEIVAIDETFTKDYTYLSEQP